MIVGRNPRNPVIGDTVLLRADNRHGVGTIVDTDAIRLNFHIGDKVRLGTRVGTITDVGTVLIQVKTAEGGMRVVCPWELVTACDR